MNRIIRITVITAAATLAAAFARPPHARGDDRPAFKLSTLSVADRLLSLEDEDLDLDGLCDILIIHRKGLHPDETRWISIFWQRADGGFSTAADQSWEIDSTAISLDIGDVSVEPGREICLLTGGGVRYHAIVDGRYDPEPRTLFETEGLMGLFPSERTIPLIDFVRDWNGDGDDEVAVFRFEGLSIFRRDETGGFTVENRLAMELRTSVGRIRTEGERELTPGLWTSYSFPAMKLIDYDADGRDDLFAIRDDRVRVYRRLPDGSFESAPVCDRLFVVLTQRE